MSGLLADGIQVVVPGIRAGSVSGLLPCTTCIPHVPHAYPMYHMHMTFPTLIKPTSMVGPTQVMIILPYDMRVLCSVAPYCSSHAAVSTCGVGDCGLPTQLDL